MSETPSTTATSYHTDPTLYLYTSLTAGSSHIITATSRLETILKANKIAFRAIDVATDEKARMLWGRRSKGRRLPGLVRYGMIIGDIVQIEEWNEYRELKRQIANTLSPADAEKVASPPVSSPAPVPAPAPAHPTPSATPHIQITHTPSRTSPTASGANTPHSNMLRQASREAAAKAKEAAAVGKTSGLKTSSSQTDVEETVGEEAKKGDAEEKLKSVEETQKPGSEGTAVESAADIKADDAVMEKEESSGRESRENAKEMKEETGEEKE